MAFKMVIPLLKLQPEKIAPKEKQNLFIFDYVTWTVLTHTGGCTYFYLST